MWDHPPGSRNFLWIKFGRDAMWYMIFVLTGNLSLQELCVPVSAPGASSHRVCPLTEEALTDYGLLTFKSGVAYLCLLLGFCVSIPRSGCQLLKIIYIKLTR